MNLLDDDGGFDVVSVDAMVEAVIKGAGEFVIDNGSASFIPMTNYLLTDNVADIFADAGKEMVIHTVITGGAELDDTSEYVGKLVRSFPSTVKIVVWINEVLGPVEVQGQRFEETVFCREQGARIGVVYIRKQNPQTTGIYVAVMLKSRLTFAEYLPGLTLPAQLRLRGFRDSIWVQLDTVLANG